MRTFVAHGHLKPTDLIWRPGFADWRPAPAVFPFKGPEPTSQRLATKRPEPARVPPQSAEQSFEPKRIRVAKTSPERERRPLGLVLGVALVVLLLAAGGTYAWLLNPSTRDNIRLGRFDGELVLRPLPDGRLMQLVKPFSYIDGTGETWDVPAGAKVDGASIPRPLWSIVGGPFEGKYRNASVIHDHYCKEQTRYWEATHRVFYEAMLASGENLKRAQLMFYAVYRFGPRWEISEPMGLNYRGYRGPDITVFEAKFDEHELAEAAALINRGDVSLSQLVSDAKAKRLKTDIKVCKNGWRTHGPSLPCS